MNKQLEDLKFLLNLKDDKKDTLLTFYLDKVNEAIRDYTRIYEPEKLPLILESLAVFKVEGLIKAREINSEEEGTQNQSQMPTGVVKSISLGKATINYQDSVGDTAIFNFGNRLSSDSLFTKEEKATMNRHRRMRFY